MLNAHRRAHPSRWLPATLFLLLFYASSGPAASSQLHAHTRTCSPTSIRRRLVAPPSSFHRSSIRTASLFHFYVPVTPARNFSTVTSRLSSLKLTTYREIFYLYPRRNVSTVYICNTWSDAGQRRVHRPRPMFPFFPSTVPSPLRLESQPEERNLGRLLLLLTCGFTKQDNV